MRSFILLPSERVQLQRILLHGSSGRVCCRAQALLWLDEGEPVDEVAERLQVSRQTLYSWVQRFQERVGEELEVRLRDGTRSGRPPSALGIIDPLLDAVIDQDPRAYSYRSTVWTAALLQVYLQDEHAIVVSRKSVSRALARLGIRWKRPRHVLVNRPDAWRQAKGG
jgi:transposase